MNKLYAPLLIPTLNRFDHFSSCVNSLLQCELSSETDLYIALDYPLKEQHYDGYNKIKGFIEKIDGFKSVNVLQREHNYGAHQNIHEAIDFLFQKYETLILTEDDNVFSTDFLLFMNKSFETYKDSLDVFSVCGYNYPVEIPKSYENEVYLWTGYSAWGVGFWRSKFVNVNWTEETVHSDVKTFLHDYRKVVQLDKIANNYVPALLHMHNIQKIHGDTYICMYQFLNKMVSVFPVISRVRNMGHDGSGINCGTMEDDFFSVQEIYTGTHTYKIPKLNSTNSIINKILYNHFKTDWNSKMKLIIKLILFRLGFTNNKQ
ncbi:MULTISPECIES: hypothetical protein [unclassified Flavobacterium]|uniref:hypothetical protein n=1 Tax=unclassified Flavobacterium TaxID=196869 RepID=UPI000556AE3E|nr:hypothetical protein [Flavobacterium sp. ASV13]